MSERGKRLNLNKDQISLVGIEYRKGATLWELARFISAASTGPIERILDNQNIQRRPPGHKPIHLVGLRRYKKQFESGLMTADQIAAKFGENGIEISGEAVRRRFLAMDGKMTLGGKKIKSE